MTSTELFLLPTVDLQSKYTTLHIVQFLRFSVRFTPSKYQPLILYTSELSSTPLHYCRSCCQALHFLAP